MASMEMIIDDRDSESFFREEVDRGRGYSRAMESWNRRSLSMERASIF